MPNRLIHETSPYLLQHAHNPVDWRPYGEEAFAEAKSANKPLLISIGYSACHWCHVMEHESFSKPEIAAVMNQNFICIKVDREERPDVDHIYMGAVQLLNGNGGWPLNCFALPDGRPFWGGTYFRPEQWLDLMQQISDLYHNSYSDLEAQAARLLKGIGETGIVKMPENPDKISQELLAKTYDQLSWNFDTELGGLRGAPKFPMPVVWQFVMNYHRFSRNAEAIAQLKTTLNRMAQGGIFDQIGGGFARYSTDPNWKVPHFEKMLYDNAQLISLFANMNLLSGEEFYSEILEKSIGFVFRELTSPEGVFYSALDADSEGEEGLFYLWNREQLREIMPEYADLLADYWGIDSAGLWEKGKSILLRPADDALFASRQHLSEEELKQLIKMAGNILLVEREKRIRPTLDDKVILSWNALMIKALALAYQSQGKQLYLDTALNAAKFIHLHFMQSDGQLRRVWKNGKAKITALLDDYAFLAEAFIALYQVTFNEEWLSRANTLVKTVITQFSDPAGPLFWYSPAGINTGDTMPAISRIINTTDGVEPSGNAVMAGVLISLGHYFEQSDYIERAKSMLINLQENYTTYPSAYACWATNAMTLAMGVTTIVISGPNAYRNAAILSHRYNPGVLIAAAVEKSELPVFHHRFKKDQNLIYKCQGQICSAPVSSIVDLVL